MKIQQIKCDIYRPFRPGRPTAVGPVTFEDFEIRDL